MEIKIGIDGNAFFVMLGEAPTGISGWGDTLEEAIKDFDNEYRKENPKSENI
jgi:hypothetical protein